MPKLPAVPKEVRPQLAADVAERYEEIREALFTALHAETTRQVKCQCGRWVTCPVPDARARAAVAAILFDQSLGKPPQVQEVTQSITHRYEGLSELTDSELADMLASCSWTAVDSEAVHAGSCSI